MRFGGFATGLAAGVNAARQGLDAAYEAQDRAKKQEMEEAIAKVANDTPQQSTGYTAQDGAQLEAMANAKDADGKPYYAVGTDDKGQYTVTPNFANPDGSAAAPVTLAQKGVTDFLGKRSEGAMTEDQVLSARQRAMAGVMMKYDPVKGMSMLQDIKRGEREDVRFKREDDAAKAEEAYKADRQAAWDGSVFAKQQNEHNAAMQTYATQKADYDQAVAAGQTGLTAPVAPTKPSYSIGDSMLDHAQMFATQAKHGKVSADDLAAFTDRRKKVEEEGYGQAMKLLHSGAPVADVVKAFNATGSVKIDPSQVVSDKWVTGNEGVKTREIAVKDANGQVMTYNALGELDKMDRADKIFARNDKQKDNERADKTLNENIRHARVQEAHSSASLGMQQNEHKLRLDELEEKKKAGEAYFREQNPDATPAQVAAARAGVIPFVPKAKEFNINMSELAQAVGTPAVDASGKPQVDPMTGRQVVNRNPKEETAVLQFMRDNACRIRNAPVTVE